MKRVFALFLALTLLLALASCAGPAPVTPTDASGNTVTTAALQYPTDALVLYGISGQDDYISAAITIFKQLYPDVTVNYTPYSDATAFQSAIQTELPAGKGPDLLLFDMATFPDMYKVMDTGIFSDINDYIAADSSFSLADYNQTVMDSGVYRGKRQIVPLTYIASLLCTSQEGMAKAGIDVSKLGTLDGFLSELQNYYATSSTPVGMFTYPFANNGVWMPFFPFGGVQLLDYDNGTVNVDAPQFKQLMDTMKAAWVEESARQLDITSYPPRGIVNGQFLFATEFQSAPYTSIMTLENVLNYVTPLLIPFPNATGATVAVPYLMSAIPAASQNKVNAYNFLKILLSNDIQSDNDINYLLGLPVLNGAVKARIDSYQYNNPSSKPVTLNDGTEWVLEKVQSKTLSNLTDMLTNIGECSLVSFNSTGNVYTTILIPDMTPYWSGTSDYATCLAKLKNDLELYVSE